LVEASGMIGLVMSFVLLFGFLSEWKLSEKMDGWFVMFRSMNYL
jgi:hypothetical protein